MRNLEHIVTLFADGMSVVDAKRPVAHNARTKQPYQPGIGPHPEKLTTQLVTNEFVALDKTLHHNHVHLEYPYPGDRRAKCDFVIGHYEHPEWAIEVKMLRMLGDNNKPNDNILMHILSPYPNHRSALTDCEKLANTPIADRQAVLIYAYDYDNWPAEPALSAFEALARLRVHLGARVVHRTAKLIHPVHERAIVAGWEVSSL